MFFMAHLNRKVKISCDGFGFAHKIKQLAALPQSNHGFTALILSLLMYLTSQLLCA